MTARLGTRFAFCPLMNKTLMVLVVLGISVGSAFADDTQKDASSSKKMKMMTMTMTTEQRQKMATAHEAMAVCLKSERPMSDCHDEMMKGCKDVMGKDGCPMMGGKGMGYGKKGHAE